MPEYLYQAVDSAGNVVSGTVAERSYRRARAELRAKGLRVEHLERFGAKEWVFFRGKQLSRQEMTEFCDRLLTIVRMRVLLAPALKEMAEDIRSKRLRALFADIREQMDSGSSFSDALMCHHHLFPPVYLRQMKLGEKAGNLECVLEGLKRHTIRMRKVTDAIRVNIFWVLLWFFIVFIAPYALSVSSMKPIGAAALSVVCAYGTSATSFAWIACCVGFYRLFRLRGSLLGCSGGLKRDRKRLRSRPIGRLCANMHFYRALGLESLTALPIEDSLRRASRATANKAFGKAVEEAVSNCSADHALLDRLLDTGYFEAGSRGVLQSMGVSGEFGQLALSLASAQDEFLSRHVRAVCSKTWYLVLALTLLGIVWGPCLATLDTFAPSINFLGN